MILPSHSVPLVQSVEPSPHKRVVVGSSPTWYIPNKLCIKLGNLIRATKAYNA